MVNIRNQLLPYLKLFLIHPELAFLANKITKSGSTYLSYSQLLALVSNANKIRSGDPNSLHIAEFGVGRGGSAQVLAWIINHYGGTLTLFDVFSQIPEPSSTDGEDALQRYSALTEDESANYYGNIPDLLETIKSELKAIGPIDRIEFVIGEYQNSLQTYKSSHHYNFVHIDCDWYESVKSVLGFLESNIHKEAILQIDDYLYWSGTKKATDQSKWLQGYPIQFVDCAIIIDRRFQIN